jgi:hypothetical protein
MTDEPIFAATLAIGIPTGRAAYLDRACDATPPRCSTVCRVPRCGMIRRQEIVPQGSHNGGREKQKLD